MEFNPEGQVNNTERKLLLIEYGELAVRKIEKKGVQSGEDKRRMEEIELGLNSSKDAILRELNEYLSSSVTD
jgi:hypothetical protein